jgi:hypothetical protein
MPGYSEKAQPYLDAIAESVFTSQEVRNWLIKGTPIEPSYVGSDILIEEQQAVRWRTRRTKQPFWANYWCGRDKRCTCRIEGSKSLESDAIFFLRNNSNRILAVHIEFKHPNEAFGFGQPEGYPLRAACFARTHSERQTLNAHDDWTTVLFCGAETLADDRRKHFQRVITHDEAATMIATYPSNLSPFVKYNALRRDERGDLGPVQGGGLPSDVEFRPKQVEEPEPKSSKQGTRGAVWMALLVGAVFGFLLRGCV